MARTYAAILGLLAFCTITFRGLLHAGNLDATLQMASWSLFVFAAIGYCAAALAALVVEESLRVTFRENEDKPIKPQMNDAGPAQRQ